MFLSNDGIKHPLILFTIKLPYVKINYINSIKITENKGQRGW